MMPSFHDDYLSHLSTQCLLKADDPGFWDALSTYHEHLSILSDLSLDPVREALGGLYCPTGQGAPTDPCAMLRSWTLMTLCREGSPTAWATRLTREPVLAILAGFTPGATPCATSYYNFLTRLVDGQYAIRSKQDVPLSQQLAGRHRLDEATKTRRAAADAAGKQQSDLLAETLLAQADQPLDPHDLQTRLDQLLVELALKPTLQADLLPQDLTVAGDGTAEPSAASGDGSRACDCPAGSKCGCPRDYLSRTAQWCWDQQHGWTFGDRSYTLSVHVDGHDLPLLTILPGGNESDFTLSLKAIDRLLKLLEDLDAAPQIRIVIGDGHHDALGIYRYLKEKGIVPIIPLDEASTPPMTPPADAAPPQTTTPPSPPDEDSTHPASGHRLVSGRDLRPRRHAALSRRLSHAASGLLHEESRSHLRLPLHAQKWKTSMGVLRRRVPLRRGLYPAGEDNGVHTLHQIRGRAAVVSADSAGFETLQRSVCPAQRHRTPECRGRQLQRRSPSPQRRLHARAPDAGQHLQARSRA